MKKIKKYVKFLLLLTGTIFICMTCEKEKPLPDKIYYDVVGEGYIFLCDSTGNILCPTQDAEIKVTMYREGVMGSWLDPDPKEYFFADANGKYNVRFMKKYKQYNPEEFVLSLRYYFSDTIYSYIDRPNETKTCATSISIYFNIEEIENANSKILIDTFKIKIKYKL